LRIVEYDRVNVTRGIPQALCGCLEDCLRDRK
jgi:hypothetical protein